MKEKGRGGRRGRRRRRVRIGWRRRVKREGEIGREKIGRGRENRGVYSKVAEIER